MKREVTRPADCSVNEAEAKGRRPYLKPAFSVVAIASVVRALSGPGADAGSRNQF